jgi:hypothetical protein
MKKSERLVRAEMLWFLSQPVCEIEKHGGTRSPFRDGNGDHHTGRAALTGAEHDETHRRG